MTTRPFLIIFLILVCICTQIARAQITCVMPDTLTTGLSSNSNQFEQETFNYNSYINEGSSTCRLGWTDSQNASSTLFVKIDLGDDYNYGDFDWEMSVTLDITLEDENSGILHSLGSTNLLINKDHPEEIIKFYAPTITTIGFGKKFILHSSSITVSETVRDAVRLKTWVELPMLIANSEDYITTLSSPQSIDNATQFSWSSNCECIPNYELQLLRLHNENPNYSTTNTQIEATVDWNKALTLETQNPDKSIRLTLAEGTGYYVWRVRPLGEEFPNGAGDSRNWGPWSDGAYWSDIVNNGEKITITDPNGLPPQVFFYEQFDKEINWIYSRTFSEGEPGEQLKIAEEMTYANGLLQVEQHQKHIYSQGNILANKTVLDHTGRPALTTLYAPVEEQDYLGYISDFANNPQGNKYQAVDFDGDDNYLDPGKITNGHLHDYYSDNNPDPFVPSAEGYAYTRTLFYGDGMGRVKEASGVGRPLSINNSYDNDTHTNRYYYSGVSDTELVRIFADEAPASNSVIKTIAVDPNQTTTVTYQNKMGQTIATCLSASNNGDYHDPLSTRASFTVQDQISDNVSCGDGCLTASKTVAFGNPTTVSLDYILEPGNIEELCSNPCTSCEYRIQFAIKRIDDPYDGNFPILPEAIQLPPNICEAIEVFTWSENFNLGPGTYLIERRITVNNTDPLTLSTSNPFGTTYLDIQLRQLEEEARTNITNNPLWILIALRLEEGETEQLYQDLINDYGMATDASEFSFTIECCEFTLPIFHCEDCPIIEDDYEAYYRSVYPSGEFADNESTTALEYLPGFENNQFNTMIQNMLSGGGYSTTDLCNCWTASVQAWESLENTVIPASLNYEANLLETFLNCTGRQYLVADIEIPFEPLHAYQWNYLIASSPDCESAICEGTSDPESPFFEAAIECNEDGLINWSSVGELTEEHWELFYQCTQATEVPWTEEETTTFTEQTVELIQSTCLTSCENRLPSFVAELERYYTQVVGAIVSVECTNSPDLPIQSGDCIPIATIYCQARQLVELCQENCEISSPISEENIEALRQSMYYVADIVPANQDGICPPNYTFSTSDLENNVIEGEDFAALATAYLNERWLAFSNNSISTAYFNVTEALNEFLPGLGDECPSVDGTDYIIVSNQNQGYFFNRKCTIIFNNTLNPESIVDQIICENICQDKLDNCGDLCLRWQAPLIPEPDFVYEFLSCEDQTANSNLIGLSEQLEACITAKVDSFQAAYFNECIHPDSIHDEFRLSYELGYYHYTLYYHDRAGNLIQTIAPKGVNEGNTNRNNPSKHKFKTQYRYNSLGQLIWQNSPDGGITRFYYNDLGQLRFSQDAQQLIDDYHTYTKYDYLGRVVETGKYINLESSLENANDPNYPTTSDSEEQTFSVYTLPFPEEITSGKQQRYLQNRVSYTYTSEGIFTVYSYDPHGNVEWLVQEVAPELEMDNPAFKQLLVEYEYDLISNKVTRLNIQPGKADQFFTAYSYDEENRITEVRTSRDGILWDRDARYEYYQHGPLRRKVLGEDQVQGVDYVYTLQGWLKSINHPNHRKMERDPGQDGISGSVVGRDAFSSGLVYNRHDFVRNNTDFRGQRFTMGLNQERDLYNGNISLWATAYRRDTRFLPPPGLFYWELSARNFRYDELNRLTNSDFSAHRIGNFWKKTDEYDSNYRYDANGNLEYLVRNAHRSPGTASIEMDRLVYAPELPVSNNRLDWITESKPQKTSPYEGDIEGRRDYTYDVTGNLIKDETLYTEEEGFEITWNLLGKVDTIKRQDGSTFAYRYDATGNRISKHLTSPTNQTQRSYYLRDAQGNMLAVYELVENGTNAWQMHQTEVPFYGSNRIGTDYTANFAFGKLDNEDNTEILPLHIPSREVYRKIGYKSYELTDHLGNVAVAVSDRKLSRIGSNNQPNNYQAEMLSAMSYYPFGSLMPKRYYLGDDQRFGFQGQEMDNEEKGDGNDIFFAFREYDSRVGRFFATDPLEGNFPWNSPYAFSENRLIDGVEFEGLEFEKINKDNSSSTPNEEGTSIEDTDWDGTFINLHRKTLLINGQPFNGTLISLVPEVTLVPSVNEDTPPINDFNPYLPKLNMEPQVKKPQPTYKEVYSNLPKTFPLAQDNTVFSLSIESSYDIIKPQPVFRAVTREDILTDIRQINFLQNRLRVAMWIKLSSGARRSGYGQGGIGFSPGGASFNSALYTKGMYQMSLERKRLQFLLVKTP